MSELINNPKEFYKNEQIELMASSGDWDMLTWFDQNIVVKHEFFFVYMGDDETMAHHIHEIVEKLNRSHLLGKGYELQVIESPLLMCKVKVKPGWHLTSSLQCKATLKKFISFL